MTRRALPLVFALSALVACGSDSTTSGDTGSTGTSADWDELSEDPLDDTDEPDACERAIDEAHTIYMSADDSNSQAQPALVREALEHGRSIYGAPRYYEFLNYYTFDLAPAAAGSVRVVPELRAVAGLEDTYTLLVSVVSEELKASDRRPANLVFSVDMSGSMGGAPIGRAQTVLRELSGELRSGDTVSVLGWSDTQSVLLEGHAVSGPDDATLESAIRKIDSGGSTNLAAGLELAYELAGTASTAETLSRVVLISDGGANTGQTEERIIGDGASDETQEGIYLTAVGVADPGGYAGNFMDQVSDLGKGAHVYVDSDVEARAMFGTDRFLSNLEIAIRDVRLELTLPPGFVIEEFHGEQMSTDPTEVEPQHLAPNDAMLYHQQIIGCLDSDEDPLFTFDVTFEHPDTREEQVVTVHATLSELMGADATNLAKADALVAFAKAAFGEDTPQAAADAVAAALAASPGDSDLAEVQVLVGLID